MRVWVCRKVADYVIIPSLSNISVALSSMKIRKIKIKNYQVFDDLELDFTDSKGRALSTIVLAGINGSGKTSLLHLLQTIFTGRLEQVGLPICEELSVEFESALNFINVFNGLIDSFERQAATRKINIEPVFPFLKNVTATLSEARDQKGELKAFEFRYKMQNNNGAMAENDFIVFEMVPSDVISQFFNVLYFVANAFALQGGLNEQRSIVKSVDIFAHKQEIEDYLVRSVIDAVLENRELTVKDAVDARIKEINQILKNININTKLIGITSEKAIFNSPNHKEIFIDDLSSGEKQLYYRAAFLSKLKIKNSLILVDEPETSLHPSWQREIIKLYQNAGDNNQVILATHSPHIMASVEPKNLFLLYLDEEEGKMKVMNMEKAQKYTKGVEPNRILQDIMGVDLRDEDTQERIDELVATIRQHPEATGQPDFDDKLQRLTRDLGPQDPSIMRINHQLFLLNRKR